jgi:alanyl-tRNA synthetase
MTASEIRQSFIDFFKGKKHTAVTSSPVVPVDDPTLLFTNAGMNQFKDILLGKGSRPYTRAVNTQKCIRVSGKHNDLEEVGHDTYHHTFFEMLGNWSFGDYYKREAIDWAWELLTDVWKLPKHQLYATVFREDDEAAELWAEVTDINPDRILRYDEKDNFWEMGETGPCGPCSEIHIDLGEDRCDKKDTEHTCAINGDCGRYIELWNLVFIQFNRDDKGKLHTLPEKHVDTGAGFERLVAVLQNKVSNYETDLFVPILDRIGELVGTQYEDSDQKSAFHVIADHIRMLSFSIADGGFPSNEGRGYVMRRILRRAARYGRNLNMHEPFIYHLVDTVVTVLGDIFPEILERSDHVASVIQAEEIHFNRTLDRGLEIFEKIKAELKGEGKTEVPGQYVFKLYDTYGFPADLTSIIAEEEGLTVDYSGFEKEMTRQQERARKTAKFKTTEILPEDWIVLMDDGPTNFVGYNEDVIETHIIKYSVKDKHLQIVLKDTPFYAESGGQIGDSGTIAMEGFSVKVIDTQKNGDEIIHICELPENIEFKSDRVYAEIDTSNRRQTEKNHTATHLLHASLRRIIGDHVQQAGSLVEPSRMRFDFTHHSQVTEDQLQNIEKLVNEKIQENLLLEIVHESFKDAKKKGAMALFGEKYGDVVRTIRIDKFSLELCGGTHVKQTGQIGSFIIVYEGSIASGVRRIEALTGIGAVEYLQNARTRLVKIGELLNTQDTDLVEKTLETIQKKREAEKELEKLSRKILSGGLEDLMKNMQTINGINVLIQKTDDSKVSHLKNLGDQIREKTTNTVALFGSKSKGKLAFVCAVTDDLIRTKHLKAGDIVRQVAETAGGSGGGKPHLATAGAKEIEKFDTAMNKLIEIIKKT